MHFSKMIVRTAILLVLVASCCIGCSSSNNSPMEQRILLEGATANGEMVNIQGLSVSKNGNEAIAEFELVVKEELRSQLTQVSENGEPPPLTPYISFYDTNGQRYAATSKTLIPIGKTGSYHYQGVASTAIPERSKIQSLSFDYIEALVFEDKYHREVNIEVEDIGIKSINIESPLGVLRIDDIYTENAQTFMNFSFVPNMEGEFIIDISSKLMDNQANEYQDRKMNVLGKSPDNRLTYYYDTLIHNSMTLAIQGYVFIFEDHIQIMVGGL